MLSPVGNSVEESWKKFFNNNFDSKVTQLISSLDIFHNSKKYIYQCHLPFWRVFHPMNDIINVEMNCICITKYNVTFVLTNQNILICLTKVISLQLRVLFSQLIYRSSCKWVFLINTKQCIFYKRKTLTILWTICIWQIFVQS